MKTKHWYIVLAIIGYLITVGASYTWISTKFPYEQCTSVTGDCANRNNDRLLSRILGSAVGPVSLVVLLGNELAHQSLK